MSALPERFGTGGVMAGHQGQGALRYDHQRMLCPAHVAMSLRRVALRRHSDHLVAETAEEAPKHPRVVSLEPAMASFAAALGEVPGCPVGGPHW
eukprot:Skav209435  [mRNA]  locus=scaffold805:184869:186808:- [translate_table: standard]